jgi:hypothetical protein
MEEQGNYRYATELRHINKVMRERGYRDSGYCVKINEDYFEVYLLYIMYGVMVEELYLRISKPTYEELK